MAYKLTLTHNERKAIDWIGGRYRHGDELASLLWDECEHPSDSQTEEYIDWNEDCDITFDIPEHVAWTIGEIIAEDNYSLACFAEDLSSKLLKFAECIV